MVLVLLSSNLVRVFRRVSFTTTTMAKICSSTLPPWDNHFVVPIIDCAVSTGLAGPARLGP